MLRCDHATPLLLLYHAMPHCFRVGVSILSPLSAYSMPPTTPTLLASISRLPWLLAAWLANRWMHRPSDKQFWRLALISRADCIVEFIKDLFLPSFVGFFLRKNESDWHFGHAQKWAASLKSLINVPLGLSWWVSDTCSVIFAAVLCSRAQSLCWAISALPNVICNQCLFLN